MKWCGVPEHRCKEKKAGGLWRRHCKHYWCQKGASGVEWRRSNFFSSRWCCNAHHTVSNDWHARVAAGLGHPLSSLTPANHSMQLPVRRATSVGKQCLQGAKTDQISLSWRMAHPLKTRRIRTGPAPSAKSARVVLQSKRRDASSVRIASQCHGRSSSQFLLPTL